MENHSYFLFGMWKTYLEIQCLVEGGKYYCSEDCLLFD